MQSNLGVNVFETRKARARYIDITATLPTNQAKVFTSKVNELFDKKIVSEEGEYAEFKITERDLTSILKSMR